MSLSIDLDVLRQRESEQVEWKENVADVDSVVKTLSAFANDLANLGGGYVVCGAREDKDEHGFPRLVVTGLGPSRLKEVEGQVMARCRDLVAPAITPVVAELPGPAPDRRILVFVQPATPHAHMFRGKEEAGTSSASAARRVKPGTACSAISSSARRPSRPGITGRAAVRRSRISTSWRCATR